MKEKAIIRFSKFKPDPGGHGGEKRSTQLFELFEKAPVKVIDFEKQKQPRTLSKKLGHFIIALKLIIKSNRFFGISSIHEARVIGLDLFSFGEIIKRNQDTCQVTHFCWEYTWSQFWYMPLIARKFNLEVIALPHNLESFVYSQRSHKPKRVLSPLWMEEEMDYLDHTNKIFCISREEQWLLSLKVNPKKVHYLPYYPPKASVDFLLNIRKKRLKVDRSNQVMILGSAVNPPTLKGMLELKAYLMENSTQNIHFDFVGYGVKWLLDDKEMLPKHISVSESVTNEELEEKLLKTSAVLIHQIPSSGALTKIQEMLIAGIPVIVNCLGARSYFNIDGVYVYERLPELDIYLSELDRMINPKIPVNNPEFENAFLSLF